MVHDGVRCVGCSISPIEGKRFECDQCYDYNLCEECWTLTSRKNKLQPSLSIPASRHFTRLSMQPSPPYRTQIFPITRSKTLQHSSSFCLPQKQEHKPDHTFTNVVDVDTDWSRALRLKKDEVFKTIIGNTEIDKKLEALKWVMNKERSTQKTASFLLEMKGEKEMDHFISKSVINNNSVLIKALRNCWENVALSLIKREVDIYVKDQKKRTPLMWACKTNQHSVVEKLLERNTKGKDYINETNEENMTALAIAVANKNDECIKHILQCDVPVEMYYHDKTKLLPFSYKNIKDFLDGQIDKIKPTWSVSSNITCGEQSLTEDEDVIEFNYNNIVKEDSAELSVIKDFVHLSRENISLLKHPLLQAMIMMKWRTFQWLWLIELVLQLLFTILMFSIGTSVLQIEANNCWNSTIVQIRQEEAKNFRQETATKTILAFLLWTFYVLVEIVQFSFSIIEIVQNLKNWWNRVFVTNETNEQKTESKGHKRKNISKIIRNFYFPIPNYLKEMENLLQLLIITIR